MSTINEFKAWLEGYEESFNSYRPYPDAEQWEKIKHKIEEIQDYNPHRHPGVNEPSLFSPNSLAYAQAKQSDKPLDAEKTTYSPDII